MKKTRRLSIIRLFNLGLIELAGLVLVGGIAVSAIASWLIDHPRPQMPVAIAYVVKPDGSDARPLAIEGFFDPNGWSPDRRYAVLNPGPTPQERSVGLWIIDQVTQERWHLTQGEYDSQPSWSPDGTKIAFVAFEPNKNPQYSSLYVTNLDGTNTQHLADGLGIMGRASWSSDAQSLLFFAPTKAGSEEDPFGSPRIHMINIDSSGKRAIETGRNASEGDLSPDGQSVVFVSNNVDNDDRITSHIWTVNLTTGVLRQLTKSLQNDYEPHWSPDGREIVYVSMGKREGDLHVMKADGSGNRNLSKAAGLPGQFPVWLSSGEIAFISFTTPSGQK